MPDFPKLYKQAWNLFNEKKNDEALIKIAEILKESYALEAAHLAGLILLTMDRIDEGNNWICSAFSMAGPKMDWFCNAARILIDKEQFILAKEVLDKATTVFGDDAVEILYLKAMMLTKLGEWEGSLVLLNHAITVNPKYYPCYITKGYILQVQGKYEEAIDVYKTIYPIASKEDKIAVVNNHTISLIQLGKYKEALDFLDKTYPKSTNASINYNKAHLLCGLGMWNRETWKTYRGRIGWDTEALAKYNTKIETVAKELEDIKGKKVFVYNEQGFGDGFMFLRYMDAILEVAESVVICVHDTLVDLMGYLKTSKPFLVASQNNPTDEDRKLFAESDVILPIIDAPYIFDTRINSVPYAHAAYFLLPYRKSSSEKPRIGLVWAGSTRKDVMFHQENAHIDKRSMHFETLEPILKLHDKFTFVSLQAEIVVDDDRIKQPLAETRNLDWLDTAQVISQLDLLISVDTSVAHLAGAMGKQVWLLTNFNVDWRWLFPIESDLYNYRRSVWYPDVTIFRQPKLADWSTVINQVVCELTGEFCA